VCESFQGDGADKQWAACTLAAAAIREGNQQEGEMNDEYQLPKPYPGQEWKCGNEFLPFHPQASHVEPAYRDGWNACYQASIKAALRAGYVPLSDDGRSVFIDGIGEVPLATTPSP
jgi:hypothetical protein